MQPTPLLKLENLSKRFLGARALESVSFEIQRGHLHAIVGENGAGKSTLMKLLVGVHQPDQGQIIFEGQPIQIGNTRKAKAVGIEIVFQEIELAPNLTVAESVFLGREPKRLLALDYDRMFAATSRTMQNLGVMISPDALINALSVAEKQLVQIARTLVSDVKVLILDEPTSALSDHETEQLFAVIEKLRAQGTTILYVSHKLEEISRLADRVTVLRDGKHIVTQPKTELTPQEMIALMAGGALTDYSAYTSPLYSQNENLIPTLELTAFSRKDAFENIHLKLYPGEVTGLFGIVGAGRTELARAIFGLDTPDDGAMKLEGKPVCFKSPADAVKARIGLVPEDRKGQGLILEMSLLRNVSLAALDKVSELMTVSSAKEWEMGARAVDSLKIATSGLETEVKNLSGGNQQKAVLAKWLAIQPKLLILDEPTKGIDVHAKREVHRIVHELAQSGIAVLLITSELEEALTVPHRLLIMREGRITAELDPSKTNRQEALSFAVLE